MLVEGEGSGRRLSKKQQQRIQQASEAGQVSVVPVVVDDVPAVAELGEC